MLELWKLEKKWWKFGKISILKYRNNAGIDALIAPGIPPANKFHLTDKLAIHMVYSFIWNVLNLPAGVLPITTILENE